MMYYIEATNPNTLIAQKAFEIAPGHKAFPSEL